MLSALRRSLERAKPAARGAAEGGAGGEAPWRADFFKLLVCRNDLDNTPDTFVRGGSPYETVFFISQSRSPGHKDEGQDCMATAEHGEWQCNVLCDGHDRDGHLVARAVCGLLPHVVLRRVHNRTDIEADIEDGLLEEAFDECANEIAWTSEGVRTGMFVKVFGGEWNGKVGYVGDSKDSGSAVVIIVDANGYHRLNIDSRHLRRAKYTGGSTCVCVIRNIRTGACRIAFTGDSRVLLVRSKVFDDPIMRPVFGLQSFTEKGKPTVPPFGITTPAHNVFSKEELLRLNTHHAGAFEIDGAFLVNPITKFAIQPTRGFGDFDMFGTGYTNIPEVSSTFTLEEGTVLFCASDGVFDEHVWKDDELVTFFDQYAKQGSKFRTEVVTELLYKETLDRSLAGGYVDDISIFCFVAPAPKLPDPEPEVADDQASVEDLESDPEGAEVEVADGEEASADEGEVSPLPEVDEIAPAKPDKNKSSRTLTRKSRKKLKAEKKHRSMPAGRKGLLGRVMSQAPKLSKTRSERGMRKQDSAVEIDEDLLSTKPDIDGPNPEDRRKTIDRKDRGSFTELSNMLKEALGTRSDGKSGKKADEVDDSEELANVVLKRFASRYGHSPDVIDAGRKVYDEAAKEGKRMSMRRSKRFSGRKSGNQ